MTSIITHAGLLHYRERENEIIIIIIIKIIIIIITISRRFKQEGFIEESNKLFSMANIVNTIYKHPHIFIKLESSYSNQNERITIFTPI
jgi:hypothetical protein